jgi:toxin ParE1/3/4
MARFELTKKAVEDLADIWNYTYENWSENQADKYYQLLIESFKEIACNPRIGKNYSGIVESLRGFKVGRHIVFFREMEGLKIEIIRILHEQMDLKNRIIEK